MSGIVLNLTGLTGPDHPVRPPAAQASAAAEDRGGRGTKRKGARQAEQKVSKSGASWDAEEAEVNQAPAAAEAVTVDEAGNSAGTEEQAAVVTKNIAGRKVTQIKKAAGSRGKRVLERAARRKTSEKDDGGGARGDSPMPPKRKLPTDAAKASTVPLMQDLPIDEKLKSQLAFLGFEKCTPIQAISVPAAIGHLPEGPGGTPSAKKRKARAAPTGDRDLMLRAPTGSGKTLAFLIPALHRVLSQECKRADGTLCVILSPTKELALQTAKVASDLTRMNPNVVCTAVAGGEKAKSEKARLRKGATVLCATPGRLAYHLENTANFSTSKLRCLVLDEADRLLDMGFEKQVRQIYDGIKRRREEDVLAVDAKATLQTFLVSATLTPAVRRLATFCLREGAYWADPDSCGTTSGEVPSEDVMEDTGFVVPESLTQWYVEVPLKERLPALLAAVASRTSEAARSIVFFSSTSSVDFHHDLFVGSRWPSIHGMHKTAGVDADVDRKSRKLPGGFVGQKVDMGDGSDQGDAEDEESAEDEDRGGDEDDEGEEEEKDPAEDRQTDSKPSDLGKKAAHQQAKIFEGTSILKLHGNLTRDERAGYIEDFKKAPSAVLLASDAASRGLDFPKVDWIIQYDPPQRIEEYLHRIGRTARIGRAGNALIFLSPSEMAFLDVLKSKGVTNIKRLEATRLHSDLLQCGAPRDLRIARDGPSLLAAELKNFVEEEAALQQLARSAFMSSMRAYRMFSRELRHCFPFHELHPGHLANSYALRETPQGIVNAGRRDAGVQSGGRGGGVGRGARGRGGRGSGRGGKGDRDGADDYGGARGWNAGSKGASKGGSKGQLGAGGRKEGRQVDRRQMGGGHGDEFAC